MDDLAPPRPASRPDDLLARAANLPGFSTAGALTAEARSFLEQMRDDASAEEFESNVLKVEKVIAGKSRGTVRIGGKPLSRDSPALSRKLGLAMAYSTNRWRSLAFFALGVALWTPLEYFVHRRVLHGPFPEGKGFWKHLLHKQFDHLHWEHHLKPWSGKTISGSRRSLLAKWSRTFARGRTRLVDDWST